jgi:hypothetical protein
MTQGTLAPEARSLLDTASMTDPIISARPRAFYAAMRSLDPVHWDEKLGMYLVSRYEDIAAIQQDPITYSVNKGYHTQQAKGFQQEFQEILERDGGGYFPDAIMSDPPYHTRIRKLMEKAFSAHRVKDLEPRIEKVVIDLIDSVADRGEADAVQDFAVPLTVRIICEQLGLDWAMKDRIARWSIAVTAQIGRMQDREQMLGHAREICDLQHYLIAKMREREADPREDMISDLVHARDAEGQALRFAEAVSLIRALLIAGNDDRLASVCHEILHDLIHFGSECPLHGCGRDSLNSKLSGKNQGGGVNLRRSNRITVIRHRSDQPNRAFDRVQAAHGALGAGDSSSVGEVASVSQRSRTRSGVQEVAIERHDNLCLREIEQRR